MGAFARRPSPVAASIERVYELFPRLRERELQKAGTLSGGEQQMLAIGRALMAEPRAPPARRAVDGPRADPRGADLRHHQDDQRAGHDGAARGAERADGARHRATRLHPADRRGRAGRHADKLRDRSGRRKAYLGGTDQRARWPDSPVPAAAVRRPVDRQGGRVVIGSRRGRAVGTPRAGGDAAPRVDPRGRSRLPGAAGRPSSPGPSPSAHGLSRGRRPGDLSSGLCAASDRRHRQRAGRDRVADDRDAIAQRRPGCPSGCGGSPNGASQRQDAASVARRPDTRQCAATGAPGRARRQPRADGSTSLMSRDGRPQPCAGRRRRSRPGRDAAGLDADAPAADFERAASPAPRRHLDRRRLLPAGRGRAAERWQRSRAAPRTLLAFPSARRALGVACADQGTPRSIAQVAAAAVRSPASRCGTRGSPLERRRWAGRRLSDDGRGRVPARCHWSSTRRPTAAGSAEVNARGALSGRPAPRSSRYTARDRMASPRPVTHSPGRSVSRSAVERRRRAAEVDDAPPRPTSRRRRGSRTTVQRSSRSAAPTGVRQGDEGQGRDADEEDDDAAALEGVAAGQRQPSPPPTLPPRQDGADDDGHAADRGQRPTPAQAADEPVTPRLVGAGRRPPAGARRRTQVAIDLAVVEPVADDELVGDLKPM